MAKKPSKADGEAAPACDESERETHLRSLIEHGNVVESDSEDVPLPPGVTHVLVKEPGADKPRLVEKRKSFF